jgi:hypothetical protein
MKDLQEVSTSGQNAKVKGKRKIMKVGKEIQKY